MEGIWRLCEFPCGPGEQVYHLHRQQEEGAFNTRPSRRTTRPSRRVGNFGRNRCETPQASRLPRTRNAILIRGSTESRSLGMAWS